MTNTTNERTIERLQAALLDALEEKNALKTKVEHLTDELAFFKSKSVIDLTGMDDAHKERLQHYAKSPVNYFRQIDGFCNFGYDGLIDRDDDDDALTWGVTWEAMQGADVRVLVSKKTTQAQAVRLLTKIRKWLKRDPGLFQYEPTETPKPCAGSDDGIPF